MDEDMEGAYNIDIMECYRVLKEVEQTKGKDSLEAIRLRKAIAKILGE